MTAKMKDLKSQISTLQFSSPASLKLGEEEWDNGIIIEAGSYLGARPIIPLLLFVIAAFIVWWFPLAAGVLALLGALSLIPMWRYLWPICLAIKRIIQRNRRINRVTKDSVVGEALLAGMSLNGRKLESESEEIERLELVRKSLLIVHQRFDKMFEGHEKSDGLRKISVEELNNLSTEELMARLRKLPEAPMIELGRRVSVTETSFPGGTGTVVTFE